MRKQMHLCFICMLCLCLMACTKAEKYEDTNGPDNYKLQTITDREIIERSVGASGWGYSETKIAGVVSKEYSSKNFNGVEQLYLTSFLLPSDVMIQVGHINVKSGNFRIVVINEDKIIDEIPLDTFGETLYYRDLKGDFAVHVAGESAAFEMFLEVQ